MNTKAWRQEVKNTELAGWSSAEMVRRYARLSAEHLAEHAERITYKNTNLAQA